MKKVRISIYKIHAIHKIMHLLSDSKGNNRQFH
jgi:hypothetical protein